MTTASAYRIEGVMIDEEGRPVEGVTISLKAVAQADTVANQGTVATPDTVESRDSVAAYYSCVSDSDGHFDMDGIEEGRYLNVISKPGYKTAQGEITVDHDFLSNRLTILADEEEKKVTELQELEVNAKALQSYGDRTELFLDSENRRFGLNALDAVSSLPLFRPSINSQKLETLNGRSVTVLINGRRASSEEIRNLKGTDIAKVVFYDNAPAHLAAFGGGPVADVLLRKPRELGFDGNISARLNYPFAVTGAVGGVMQSPEHYINGNINAGHSNIHGLTETTEFDYGDLLNSFECDNGKYRNTNSSYSLSYQWDHAGHMLYADARYSAATSYVEQQYDIRELGGSADVDGVRGVNGHDTQDNARLNLYYSYRFDDRRMFCIDMVGNYDHNTSATTDFRHVGQGSAYGNYNVAGLTSNRMLTYIGSAMFTTPVWRGNLSATLYYNYRHLNQDYYDTYFSDEKSATRNRAHDMGAYGNYSISFGRLWVSAMIMVCNTHIILSDRQKHNEYAFLPRLSLSYRITDDVTLRGSANIQTSQNSIGVMNTNGRFIDVRYFSENLPYEKSVVQYNYNLGADISIPGMQLYVSPGVRYSFIHNPYVEYVYRDGADFIKRSLAISSEKDLSYGLGISWRPFAGFSLTPYVGGELSCYDTPAERVRFHHLSARASASYMVSDFQFMAQYTSPVKRREGVMTSRQGNLLTLNAYWRKGHWTLGLDYTWQEPGRHSLTEVSGFRHYITSGMRGEQYRISAVAAYTFHAGRTVNASRQRKQLNNSATDTGRSMR